MEARSDRRNAHRLAVTLDEALQFSPLGMAFNLELTAQEIGRSVTPDAIPLVSDRTGRDDAFYGYRAPTNFPTGKAFVPVTEFRKRPLKKIHKQHPGWVPVVWLDPVLNIATLEDPAL